MDASWEKQTEGMTSKQKKLLASIYAGLAAESSKKKVAACLKNWIKRDDWSRN